MRGGRERAWRGLVGEERGVRERRGWGVELGAYVPALVLGALWEWSLRGSRADGVLASGIAGTARVRAVNEIRTVKGGRIERRIVVPWRLVQGRVVTRRVARLMYIQSANAFEKEKMQYHCKRLC